MTLHNYVGRYRYTQYLSVYSVCRILTHTGRTAGLQLHIILNRIDELNVSWRDEFIEELQVCECVGKSACERKDCAREKQR